MDDAGHSVFGYPEAVAHFPAGEATLNEIKLANLLDTLFWTLIGPWRRGDA